MDNNTVPKDLALFATEDYPLHPSGMRLVMTCPWRISMLYLYGSSDTGGPAGDTGSAMHKAAHAFHTGKEVAESIEIMGDNLSKYPKADLMDAADMFLKYASDPRNRDAKVVAAELPISFQIAPAPEDHTQAPIQIIGTLDQIREEHGRLRLWDIKTSKKPPRDILDETLIQAAGYCVGGTIALGRDVHPGGIIVPRQYGVMANVGKAPVHWHFPWKFVDLEQILFGIRVQVANIRAGKIWHVPNPDCKWCEAQSPDNCLPKLISLNLRG